MNCFDIYFDIYTAYLCLSDVIDFVCLNELFEVELFLTLNVYWRSTELFKKKCFDI